ncbi:hypothetical protein V6N11_071425 [Hibiscus sabdariffa]|uniref:Uncharacterized protein n=1 Tax=Hibiscus sabdariffa TaxID=183260 RepID=A0ABR2U0L4_9ROSI
MRCRTRLLAKAAHGFGVALAPFGMLFEATLCGTWGDGSNGGFLAWLHTAAWNLIQMVVGGLDSAELLGCVLHWMLNFEEFKGSSNGVVLYDMLELLRKWTVMMHVT